MAHDCPDCWLLCHCGGDIDDINFGEEGPGAMRCTHCKILELDDYDDPPDGFFDED